MACGAVGRYFLCSVDIFKRNFLEVDTEMKKMQSEMKDLQKHLGCNNFQFTILPMIESGRHSGHEVAVVFVGGRKSSRPR